MCAPCASRVPPASTRTAFRRQSAASARGAPSGPERGRPPFPTARRAPPSPPHPVRGVLRPPTVCATTATTPRIRRTARSAPACAVRSER
eukprot:3667055-Rhodomonas_salina.1